jgi:hypothetical protein
MRDDFVNVYGTYSAFEKNNNLRFINTLHMRQYLLPITIGLSVILTALILSNAYKYRFKSAEEISVVGLAEVDFTSDLIVWQGSFQRKSPDLRDAYAMLKSDEKAIRSYFRGKMIPDSAMVFSSVGIEKEFDQTIDSRGNAMSVFSGYRLTQRVKIQSTELDRIESVSREVTELIQTGIEFQSEEPLYFYTRLSTLKMDLLAKASADARQRAETIARSVDSRLDRLKRADMGVFQITGKNSNEDYSYGGAFNTTDKQKTASITIRMDYRLK